LARFRRAITHLVLSGSGLATTILGLGAFALGGWSFTDMLRMKAEASTESHDDTAMSLIVSGGGARTGQVIGSTTSKVEHPKASPLTPNDLWATMYKHLGIEPEQSFPDHTGRPMPILPHGNEIREMWG
jgi:hypothetical protein